MPADVVGLATALTLATTARAEDDVQNLPPTTGPSTPQQRMEAIDQEATPIPIKTQLQFKPTYTFPNGSDRYTAELEFAPILPYAGTLIPDLEIPGVWSIARVRVSGESTQNSQGTFTGITDLNFVDLAASRAGPFNIGAGYGTVFPMATSPQLGQQKWQLGPAVGMRLEDVHPMRIAALVQNLYSVAGSSQASNLAYVTVQPFITLELPADLFVSTDAEMDFYWRGGQSKVPVDLNFGRAFSEHFVGSLQFWYVVAESDQGDIRMRAVLNFQP